MGQIIAALPAIATAATAANQGAQAYSKIQNPGGDSYSGMGGGFNTQQSSPSSKNDDFLSQLKKIYSDTSQTAGLVSNNPFLTKQLSNYGSVGDNLGNLYNSVFR